jgi:ATP-binding cassette subfamily C (CFTR/MRP) protein 4
MPRLCSDHEVEDGNGVSAHTAFLGALENYGRAWYWWLMANRWVGFQLDMISTCLLATTVTLGVLLREDMDAGLIGLAIAYAIQVGGWLQHRY